MAFSSVSTRDPDIRSSCEMKDEPAFKGLQGKPAFFWVRASRGPLYLRQKTQSRSHIPISDGRLLLRCLWKAGLPLQSKTGNHSHPQTIWGARKFPQDALMKLMILCTRDGFLRESLEFPKGSQATCSVWWGSQDHYGANAREIGLISIWFWVHRAILHSWGNTLTFTNTAFSPAGFTSVKEYFPESSRVELGMTRKAIVSTKSTCPFLTTLSIPTFLQVTLGAGRPLTMANSRMGHPALTVTSFLMLASKSISGGSTNDTKAISWLQNVGKSCEKWNNEPSDNLGPHLGFL